MATTVTQLIFGSQIQWDLTESPSWGTRSASGSDGPGSEKILTAGTAAGQVDQVFLYRGQLAASGSITFDLIGGGLLDPLGNAIAIVKLKGIYFRQLASASYTGTHCLVGQAAATSVLAYQQKVCRGGVWLVFDPSATGIAAVAAGASDNFRVVNADASNGVDFFLALAGTTV